MCLKEFCTRSCKLKLTCTFNFSSISFFHSSVRLTSLQGMRITLLKLFLSTPSRMICNVVDKSLAVFISVLLLFIDLNKEAHRGERVHSCHSHYLTFTLHKSFACSVHSTQFLTCPLAEMKLIRLVRSQQAYFHYELRLKANFLQLAPGLN